MGEELHPVDDGERARDGAAGLSPELGQTVGQPEVEDDHPQHAERQAEDDDSRVVEPFLQDQVKHREQEDHQRDDGAHATDDSPSPANAPTSAVRRTGQRPRNWR